MTPANKELLATGAEAGPRRAVRLIGLNLALGLACGLSASGIQALFALINERVIIFWVPAGLMLGAALLFGPRVLFGAFLGIFINSVHYGLPPVLATFVALGDCLGVLAAYALLARGRAFDPTFSTGHSYLRLLAAAMVSGAVGASIGLLAVVVGGRIPIPAAPVVWLRWWMGDVLGLLLVVPVLLLFGRRPMAWLSRERSVEFGLFLAIAFLVGQAGFLGWGPGALLPYLSGYFAFLTVSYAAVRFGPHGVTLVLLLTAAQALIGAALGKGFFATDPAQTHLTNFWMYMVTLTVVGITVASTIRERKQAEESVKEAASFKDQVLAGVPGGLMVYGPDGRVLFANTRACALLGIPSGDLLRQSANAPTWELLAEDGTTLPREAYPTATVLATGAPVWNQVLMLRRPGMPDAWLLVNAFPEARADGSLAKVIVIFLDITDRKAEEQERRRLEGILQHTQKMESLGRLSGGIAHDMNNVLAGIMMVTSTLQARLQGQGDVTGQLDTVLSASERGRDLVRKLLEFSRQDLDQPQAVDLNDLVRKELEILEHTTRQKVALEADLAPDLPWVFGEPSALSAGLMNLSVNALDAMEGGGILKIRTRPLPNGGAELTVTDTGCGMTEAVMARAFDPFFTTKPVGKGTGLGLSMLHSALKVHGASVTVASEVGKGSTFRLCFPPLAPEKLPTAKVEAPVAEPAPVQAGASILLVDDDPLMRETTPALLRTLGMQVEALDRGEACLDYLRSGGNPELVILDHNMPGLTGLETLRQLRTEGFRVPVVLASGFLDSDQERELRSTPRVWILRKPYGLKEMKRLLPEILGA